MKTAILFYGMPTFLKLKRNWHSILLGDSDTYYFAASYIATKNHDTLYHLDDNAKSLVSEYYPNTKFYAFSKMSCLIKEYYPKLYEMSRKNCGYNKPELWKQYIIQATLNEYVWYKEFYELSKLYNRVIVVSMSFVYDMDHDTPFNFYDKDNWFRTININRTVSSGIFSCDSVLFRNMIDDIPLNLVEIYKHLSAINLRDQDAELARLHFFSQYFVPTIISKLDKKRSCSFLSNNGKIYKETTLTNLDWVI